MQTSAIFKNFVNQHQLIEHKLTSRKYTWTNGRHFALLDRFFTSIQWEHQYPASYTSDLTSYGSDHCPIILSVSTNTIFYSPVFRFDPLWLDQPEFVELVSKWWNQFHLDTNHIAKSWNNKLKFIRHKIKGWTRNFYSSKKKKKKNLLARLQELEIILEHKDFTLVEHDDCSLPNRH